MSEEGNNQCKLDWDRTATQESQSRHRGLSPIIVRTEKQDNEAKSSSKN